MNVGADQDGHVSFTGKGRFFGVFGEHYALQAQAEYLYANRNKEGQFDIGLVDRIGQGPGRVYSPASRTRLSTARQNSGNLGQAALTVDYLFKWGKLGIFGTKGFLDNARVYDAAYVNPATGYVSSDLFTMKYLKIADQVGVSATVGSVGQRLPRRQHRIHQELCRGGPPGRHCCASFSRSTRTSRSRWKAA